MEDTVPDIVSFELTACVQVNSSTHITQGIKGKKHNPKCPACNPINQEFIRYTHHIFFFFSLITQKQENKTNKNETIGDGTVEIALVMKGKKEC